MYYIYAPLDTGIIQEVYNDLLLKYNYVYI